MTTPVNNSDYYTLPDGLSRIEFLKKLANDHKIVLDPPQKKKEEFFDTFDRRLYSSNLVLVKEDNSYHLKSLTDGRELQAFEDTKKLSPKFWWDFPKCSLRAELKPLSSIRALLSLAKIERTVATLKVLNEDKKTVLFIFVKELVVISDQRRIKPCVVVQLKNVRGYEKEFKEFKSYIEELGLKNSKDDIISAAVSNQGKYPLNYTSKINVKLKPDMKGHEAARLIFENLLGTMKVNEFGIKDDIDTEFLHDFRVAVRRTRSALSQVKSVFSPEDTDKYKEQFSVIGKATNELRDLDVYLLTEDSYKKMLPEDLRGGLDPLFDKLTQDRKKACTECAQFLNSKNYKEIISDWQEFLHNESSDANSAANSQRPIIEISKEHIWKKYSKIIKQGRKINDATPDPELHSLRIECKKLRYLLEFFTSLFPADDMKTIIKHLKVLQDNLGDFNDLHVQQESLKKFLSSKDIGYDQSSSTVAAAGGLVSVLYQQQAVVRKKFKENFNEFSDKETTELFEKLFSDN
ncbi:MAG: CHAD domain-containing protein [Thermodesulfobacteriota bacterium]